MSHLIAILAYDRLCTFEFGCAVEVFALNRSELGVEWYRHVICGIEPSPLWAMGGIQVQASHGLEVLLDADTIVIPGWRDANEVPPQDLLDALQAAHLRGVRICSICSGVFVLAHAGILTGKRVTTHWRYAETLAAQFPDLIVDASALYIDQDSVITSAGSAAGLDMLLHIVRQDYGAKVSNQVAQRLVMSPHRDGGQAQFIPRPMPVSKINGIAKLMDWLQENLALSHTIESMARQAHISSRTLQRQFKDSTGLSPIEWLIQERIAFAKELLESKEQLTIDQVAELAGFGSTESLRRHFRIHGIPTTTQYRYQFRHVG